MKRLTLILAVLALLIAACGAGDGVGDAGPVDTADVTSTLPPTTEAPVDSTTPPSDAGEATTTTVPPTTTIPDEASELFVYVYFVKDGTYAEPVGRTIPGTTDVAANAIRALIAGPTAAEEQEGLFSAVPADTLLLGIALHDGLATVDLSKEFEAGGGSFSMIARLAQVVYTLTEFPTIDEVEFHLDGEPVTVFSSEGLLLEEPVDTDDFVSALPLEPVIPTTIERWDQNDLPAIDQVASSLRRVVLVAEDDVLNVRFSAGVDHPIIGSLLPGVIVIPTGSETVVSGSTWSAILTPEGLGWVNARFLAEVVDDEFFAGDPEVTALLDELAAVIAADGDLSKVVSERGLYVSHHATPVRFSPDELVDILTDPTTYKWPSNALDVTDPDQAAEIRDRTFAEAITDRVLSTYDDPDLVTSYDEPNAGGNGRIPEAALPFELAGFHYVGLYDSGDNPDYGGLDWTTWYVSIDYEDGEPVVVGLTLDEWSP